MRLGSRLWEKADLPQRTQRKYYLFAIFFRHIISPMESVDQQFRQQKENYAHMTEEELCALAEEAYDLTEIAREALQAEISERGLNIQLKAEPEQEPTPAPAFAGPPEGTALQEYGWFYSLGEAKQAKDVLTNAGIPCYFGPVYIEAPEDFKGNFELGLPMKVRDVDWQRALAAFRHAWQQEEEKQEEKKQEEEPEDTEEKDFAVLCPKCHSDAVVLENCEGASPRYTKYNWSCDACGHQWKDEGIEQEVPAGEASQEEGDDDRDPDQSDPDRRP